MGLPVSPSPFLPKYTLRYRKILIKNYCSEVRNSHKSGCLLSLDGIVVETFKQSTLSSTDYKK